MSEVLFLNIPSHGHINPTLGLVEELIKAGEKVTYFSTDNYRDKIESTGAIFKTYGEQSDFFTPHNKVPGKSILEDLLNRMEEVLYTCEDVINYILKEISGTQFDYIIYGSMFPFGNVIAQILKIPSISSFAVFAKPKAFECGEDSEIVKNHRVYIVYKEIKEKLKEKYKIDMPPLFDLFFNRGDLNIVYTSRYFVSDSLESYDSSFIFIGPPIYKRKENLKFPFEKIDGKKVIYISLGTVFNSLDVNLYKTFFDAFGNTDVTVVMTAYNMDTSKFEIPSNFIVQNYVPQLEILKYTQVAITHGGMNSTSDLLYCNIPFVTIPIGADQRYIANRVDSLGATIVINKDEVTSQKLKDSVYTVCNDPQYIRNINKISKSFKEAGGYKMALEEVLKLKKEKIE